MRRTTLIMLVLAMLPLTAHAELYRWVDGAGRAFFADDLTKVPPEHRDRARKVDQSGDLVNVDTRSTGGKPAGTTASAQTDNNGRGESWWRTQADNLRKQIRAEEGNIAFYTEKRRECEESQKNIIGRRKNCAELYRCNQDRSEWNIQQLRNKLDVELPEEARKAGAYPGWLRE